MATQTSDISSQDDNSELPSLYVNILNELKKGPLTTVPIASISHLSFRDAQVSLNKLVDIGIVQKYKFYSKSGYVKAMYALRNEKGDS